MTEKDYTAYKQRWLILAGVLACAFMRGYFPGMFAISNDMMTEYFRISPLQADMLSSADTAIAVIVCLMTSIIGKKVGVRFLSLTTAIIFGLSCVAIGIAITSRDFYVLMLSGRLASGLASALLYILPPILANAWFPSYQVATAAALPVTAMCVGGVVSPMIFSNLLPKAINATVNTNATLNSSSLEIERFDLLQKVFIINMAVFVALSLLSLGMFCLYAKNHPPTPPSGAQVLLLKTVKKSHHKSELKQNFRSLLQIIQLRSFWSVLAITVGNAATLAFTLYLQPSLLKATFDSASNAVAGYCLVLGTLTAACGSVAAGKILDRWHNYKKLCLISSILINGSAVAIYFSLSYKILWIFFVFQGIVGFLRLCIYVCTVELVLEVTYPRDRTVAACIFFAFYNFSTFTWTPVERWVMARFGEQYVSWVVVFSQTMGALILLLSKPKYKRTMANKTKIENWKSTESECELRPTCSQKS